MFRQRRLAAVDLGLSPELRHSRPFSVIPAPFPSFPRKRESILIIDKKQARLSHPRSSPGATKKKTKEHKRIFTTGNTGAATRRFRGPPWIISVSINTHTTLANGIAMNFLLIGSANALSRFRSKENRGQRNSPTIMARPAGLPHRLLHHQPCHLQMGQKHE